jgi:DnaJ-class molecular chaperone
MAPCRAAEWSGGHQSGPDMATRPGSPRTHYQTLMLDPTADAELVSAVHRRLAQRYHPDLHPGPAAYGQMLDLNRAYDVLRDPERRALYDRQLARGPDPWDGHA